MVLGALVRAHGAGLACPDWPLCFGQVIPQMDLKVAFEWSHRAVAGGVGIVFAVLAILCLRRPGLARRVRATLLAAAVLLGVQILLGALTVWKLLAVWTVTAHLVTANLFAMALLMVTLQLRELAGTGHEAPLAAAREAAPAAAREAAPAARRGPGRFWVPVSAFLLAVQIVLGGLVSSSYAGMACPEWPACINGEWFPAIGGNVTLHLLHRTNGYLVFVALAAAAVVCRGRQPLAGLTAAGLALAVAQVVVGVLNVQLGLPAEVTGLHSLLAALLVLTLTAAVLRAFAVPSPARA